MVVGRDGAQLRAPCGLPVAFWVPPGRQAPQASRLRDLYLDFSSFNGLPLPIAPTTPPPAPKMTLAAFCKWSGVSRQYVGARRQEGRIVGEKDRNLYMIDVAATMARLGKQVPGATAPPVSTGDSDGGADYHSERSLHERARRQLAELKLAQARRELVPARAVEGYCGRVGTMVRERVLAIENASLTRMDAAAQLWLAGELRSALTFLADALDREGAGLLDGSVAEVEDAPDEAPA